MTFAAWLARVALVAVVAANIAFIHTPGSSITVGEPFTISWDGADPSSPVTITLKRGDPDNLETVELITSNGQNGQYTWTPSSSLTPGDDYALEISQGSGFDETNYSGEFSIVGSSAATTSRASQSKAASTATPASSTTAASSSTRSTQPTTTSHSPTSATATATSSARTSASTTSDHVTKSVHTASTIASTTSSSAAEATAIPSTAPASPATNTPPLSTIVPAVLVPAFVLALMLGFYVGKKRSKNHREAMAQRDVEEASYRSPHGIDVGPVIPVGRASAAGREGVLSKTVADHTVIERTM